MPAPPPSLRVPTPPPPPPNQHHHLSRLSSTGERVSHRSSFQASTTLHTSLDD
ncbi:hypothetical protein IE53DRAFT_222523 [Violaceomyces palustris]|uniref:Uncharacterized protein n=1 Tax=Violaceomyces palustris TaxID=1673888 RepID=A0ACD0P4Q5_9BASI|nr:hypothetical protein IE53DRAFT_222523 [Violaceomyces palustris]